MHAVTTVLPIKSSTQTPPVARHDAPLTGFERVFAARADTAGRDRSNASDASDAESAPSDAQRTTADAQQPRKTTQGVGDASAVDPNHGAKSESNADHGAVDQESESSPNDAESSAPTGTDAELIASSIAAPALQSVPTDSAGAESTAAGPSEGATMTAAAGFKTFNDSVSASAADPSPGDTADVRGSASAIDQHPIAGGSNTAANSPNTHREGTNSDRSAEAGGQGVQAVRADNKISSDAAAGESSEPGVSRAAASDPSAGAGAEGRADSGESRAAREFIQNIARASETAGAAGARDAEGSDESVAFRAQVSRGLEAALRHDGGAVTLRLKPDSLGALRIDLQVRGGEVAASFQSSSREAHELLSTQLSSLRASLEAKGLSVRAMEVQPPPAPNGAHNDTGASRDTGMQQNGGQSDAGASSGSNTSGRAHSGREDPAGVTNPHAPVALAEVEPTGPGWIRVGVRGSLDAVA